MNLACEKYSELMMKYMDGLLDDFEQMNLDKHIEACEACREDFAIYQEMLTSFDHNNMEIIEAPENFVASVMEKVDDINLYFPQKVRDKGKVVDSIIFAVWAFLASAFVAGTVLFLQGEAIFGWLNANGLHAIVNVLQPFTNFMTGLGQALGYHLTGASEWLSANISNYAIVFL
ncbi:MAG: zf-HC2 domain-containing protein, partial [Defluviitaleaceae bacterium]|nr:zf-HC2 domain-containing protein [Defluviitaleaceae bacterium]